MIRSALHDTCVHMRVHAHPYTRASIHTYIPTRAHYYTRYMGASIHTYIPTHAHYYTRVSVHVPTHMSLHVSRHAHIPTY